ncbi:MAG: thioredoxin family protein, partial [Bacteroidales bacterium]
TVQKAVKELGLDATVGKEEDLMQIMSYNVMQLPALVVNGIVITQGKKLSLLEVKELLKK